MLLGLRGLIPRSPTKAIAKEREWTGYSAWGNDAWTAIRSNYCADMFGK